MTPPGTASHGHHHHVDATELVSLEDHRRDVLGRIVPLEAIALALLEAHGCVLAEDVVAEQDVPAFANSAMDGFALRSAEVAAGDRLTVAGEIAAGSGERPSPGRDQAIRIMTGAPLPDGADAVVPLELVDEADGAVVLRHAPQAGENVRPAGEDARAGTTVLHAGRRLEAAAIGMCAALGKGRVMVRPRPRVAVLSTGDELTEPDQPLRPGFIHDSNSYTLACMVREAGAVAFRETIVRDDRRALEEAFDGAMTQADLVVVSGGVSAGRYDLSKQVLAQMGDVSFRKVGMQPGMPQAFGFLQPARGRPVPVFGLPGNPVSAAVSFEVFVRPALRRLQDRRDLNRPRVHAVWDAPVSSPEHKVSFLRVRLHRDADRWHATPTGAQGSGILRSMVLADGLAEVPVDRTRMEAGEQVLVHLLVEAG